MVWVHLGHSCYGPGGPHGSVAVTLFLADARALAQVRAAPLIRPVGAPEHLSQDLYSEKSLQTTARAVCKGELHPNYTRNWLRQVPARWLRGNAWLQLQTLREEPQGEVRCPDTLGNHADGLDKAASLTSVLWALDRLLGGKVGPA